REHSDLGERAGSQRQLEGAAPLVHQRRALELDHRHLDLAVDPAEDSGEKVVTQHLRLGGSGRAALSVLVERGYAVADSCQERVAAEWAAGGHTTLLAPSAVGSYRE